MRFSVDYNKVICAFQSGSHWRQGLAGFAFALALDVNEIHIEMHIELCYNLSRYKEYHLITIKADILHLLHLH